MVVLPDDLVGSIADCVAGQLANVVEVVTPDSIPEQDDGGDAKQPEGRGVDDVGRRTSHDLGDDRKRPAV